MLLNAIQSGFDLPMILMCALSSVVVIFLTLPVHEWAHGFVSTKLGDPTPRYQGRLTLNPLAHIDPVGAIGILLFGIGWAKPVEVNARYYKNPKWGMAAVAAAGPISNVIVAFVSVFLLNLVYNVTPFANSMLISNGILYTISGNGYSIVDLIIIFLYYIAVINISLAVFNLIPIPPFDGSRILFTFLPQRYYFTIMRYERYIFLGVLLILFVGVLDYPIKVATDGVFNLVWSLASLPFRLFGN